MQPCTAPEEWQPACLDSATTFVWSKHAVSPATRISLIATHTRVLYDERVVDTREEDHGHAHARYLVSVAYGAMDIQTVYSRPYRPGPPHFTLMEASANFHGSKCSSMETRGSFHGSKVTSMEVDSKTKSCGRTDRWAEKAQHGLTRGHCPIKYSDSIQ